MTSPESTDFNTTLIQVENVKTLPDRSLGELLAGGIEAQTLHIPETYISIIQHPLSRLPTDATERAIYESHQVRAPEMVLERLKDCYWIPETGFLISREGKVWRHSTLGQYFDPHFTSTGAVEERAVVGGEVEYIFHEHLLADVPIIRGLHLLTSHYASTNYGHFLLDMVPLIDVARQQGLAMLTRPLLPWQSDIYRAMTVDPGCVHQVAHRVVFLEDVIVSNRHNAQSTYCAHPAHRDLFDEIIAHIAATSAHTRQYNGSPRKLFLMRKDSRTRHLQNRKPLAKALKRMGIEAIYPDDLSFEEQVLLMTNTNLIVSEFGALLANVGFCQPGTIVVEIIPEGQHDPWSVHMCAALGLEHIALFQKVRDKDRENISVGNSKLNNIYFRYKADIDCILRTIASL